MGFIAVQPIQYGDWNSSKTGVPRPMLACTWAALLICEDWEGCKNIHPMTKARTNIANARTWGHLDLRRRIITPAMTSKNAANQIAEY
jgi:hypothetical protein